MLKLNYKENQCLCFCEATDVIDIPFTITYPIGTGLLDFLAYNDDRFLDNLWDFITYLFKTKSKNIKDDCKQDFFDYFAINGANIYLNVYARTIITTINKLLNRKPMIVSEKVKNVWEYDFFEFANDKIKAIYQTLPDETQRQIMPCFIEVIVYLNDVVGEIKDYKKMVTSELNILYKIIENKGYETLTSEQILFAMDYHRPYETKKTEIFYQNTVFSTTMMMYLEDKNFEAFTTSIHENIEGRH